MRSYSSDAPMYNKQHTPGDGPGINSKMSPLHTFARTTLQGPTKKPSANY